MTKSSSSSHFKNKLGSYQNFSGSNLDEDHDDQDDQDYDVEDGNLLDFIKVLKKSLNFKL